MRWSGFLLIRPWVTHDTDRIEAVLDALDLLTEQPPEHRDAGEEHLAAQQLRPQTPFNKPAEWTPAGPSVPQGLFDGRFAGLEGRLAATGKSGIQALFSSVKCRVRPLMVVIRT
jgi:hypothetical protein